ncbi:hypothetical protein GCM10025734_22360 [Kitasatospora paranensis]
MVEAYGGRQERAGQVPFVGRAAEVGLLDTVLDQLKGGGPAVVDVTGEAGIGKSRLLAQFGARIRSRGMTVLSGQATEYEQHSPFRPFADAFADLSPVVLRRFPALAELSPALRGVADTPAAPGAATGSPCTRPLRPCWAGSARTGSPWYWTICTGRTRCRWSWWTTWYAIPCALRSSWSSRAGVGRLRPY